MLDISVLLPACRRPLQQARRGQVVHSIASSGA